jgi:hypothetical protein
MMDWLSVAPSSVRAAKTLVSHWCRPCQSRSRKRTTSSYLARQMLVGFCVTRTQVPRKGLKGIECRGLYARDLGSDKTRQ